MHRRLLDAGLSVSPADGNKTHDKFVGDVNFDANMVIILAALLSALICALGLNSIVRCVLRCGHRFSTETTEQAAVRLASTGLKKRHLSKIPVKEYGPGANIPATECPICLGEFEKGDKVRMLPKCNHGFHVRCIDTWLLSHSSCPNCRHSLLEKSTNLNPNPNSNPRSEGGGVAEAQGPSHGSGGGVQVHATVVVVDEQAS